MDNSKKFYSYFSKSIKMLNMINKKGMNVLKNEKELIKISDYNYYLAFDRDIWSNLIFGQKLFILHKFVQNHFPSLIHNYSSEFGLKEFKVKAHTLFVDFYSICSDKPPYQIFKDLYFAIERDSMNNYASKVDYANFVSKNRQLLYKIKKAISFDNFYLNRLQQYFDNFSQFNFEALQALEYEYKKLYKADNGSKDYIEFLKYKKKFEFENVKFNMSCERTFNLENLTEDDKYYLILFIKNEIFSSKSKENDKQNYKN